MNLLLCRPNQTPYKVHNSNVHSAQRPVTDSACRAYFKRSDDGCRLMESTCLFYQALVVHPHSLLWLSYTPTT